MSETKDISIKGIKDTLKIKNFTLDMFVQDPAIIMIAKRGSGKSWVVRAVLDFFKDIPVGLIIAPTDRMNKFYGKFFPDTYIHYDYKTEIIQNVLTRQTQIIEKEAEKRKIGKKIDPRAFIIMDDCLGQKGSWVRDRPIQELLFNGRHYRLMYILTMQFPLGITPELRCNFDYIFLLADDTVSNQKRIYDHYAGMFPSFDSFRQVFTQLTSDFGSMVLVNRGVKSSLFDKVFYYKAPDLSKLTNAKFGCTQFRKYHENNYNLEWKKKSSVLNEFEWFASKKKNKSGIVVEKEKKTKKY
jgi:hypothetical protein